MRDKQDYQALLDEKLHKKMEGNKDTFIEFIRADLDLNYITASSEWNTYLEFLQGMKNTMEETHKVLKEDYETGYDLSDQTLRENKIQIILNRERLELLELVMSLPKLVGDSARAAKKLIKKYEKS